MIACERAQSLFGRAWDDELTVAERDGLELHMKDCAGCRREYDELARTLELVQALPRPAVKDDFATRVLAEALRRENEAPARRRIFAFPSMPSFEISFGRPAMALAATFVVALGISAFLMRGPVTTSETPLVANMQPRVTEAPVVAIPEPTPAAPVTIASVDPAPRREVTAPASTPRRATTNSALAVEAPAIPDSLFDHTADVELVLDPVKLRHERGRGYTPTSVRGEAASITF